ncbi:MAG: UDP-N-acetylmuramoyl-L-alanine--D-glutamate ligase [Solirubrobacteraceae bacterium]
MPSPRPPLPDGPFVVVGLKRSGLAVARALRAAGAEVRGCDAGEADTEALIALGVEVRAPGAGLDLLPGARTVVKSPGVPQDAPVVVAARERGLRVVGELEIGWRMLAHEMIAVTGSNGKTTTTELIGHIHREAGLAVAVAGNVGTALSSLALKEGRVAPDTVVVCEASSFQLEDTELFAPEGAVLLNVTPDHLDRHGTLAAYTAAKLQVFARQGNDDVAVAPLGLGIEDLGGCARRVCFGAGPGAELADRAGQLWWGDEQVLIATADIRLRGEHNRRNAMAAAAVTLARGVEPAAVRAGLATFAGVPHRLEEVATVAGVAYVNDSKATNVDAAVTGLRGFDGGVHVILGGRGLTGDLAPLVTAVRERAAGAYLIGESADQLADALATTGVPLARAGDMEHAVAAAAATARPGEVVLLSPAAKSFDQYADFEARGDHFRSLARARAGLV